MSNDSKISEQNQVISPEISLANSYANSEEMFGLLVDAVNDYAIFALDPNGIILTWNSGARRLKGYEKNEVIGTHFSRFYTQADIDSHHPDFELREALKNGSYEEEGWRVTKTGTRFWANVVITALKDSKGVHRGFAKVTRDLTERKIAQDKLQKAYESLEKRVEERTSQLAEAKNASEHAVKARDEFLSIASHELKTPLTSLKLQIQMRKRHIAKGLGYSVEKLKELIEDDDKQINRIGRLIDDMLDITHIAAGKMTLELSDTDLSKLATDVIKRFTGHFEEQHIFIKVNVSPDVIGHWDQYRIEQVFINLLTNAIKYGEGKPVEVNVTKTDKMAVLTVHDNGIGIKEEDQTRVFQQYERAVSASAVSGLGLGLFICKQIIEAHHGRISIESKLGKGSTFIVELPLK